MIERDEYESRRADRCARAKRHVYSALSAMRDASGPVPYDEDEARVYEALTAAHDALQDRDETVHAAARCGRTR